MWATILKYAAKGLVWVAENPEAAKAAVDEAISIRNAIKAAKEARKA